MPSVKEEEDSSDDETPTASEPESEHEQENEPRRPSPKDLKKQGQNVRGVDTRGKKRKLEEELEQQAGDDSATANVSGTLSIAPSPSLPLCLQSSDSSDDEASLVTEHDRTTTCSSSSFSNLTASLHEFDVAEASENGEMAGQSFADLLKLIAEYSDVQAEPKAIFKSAQFVHLASENFEPPPESLALTTNRSLPEFLLAWWREFANRDMGGGEARALKWGHLFRQRDTKPAIRPYTPADDVIISEPLADPPVCYKWMTAPPQRMDVTAQDAKHFEGVARQTLNVTNFMEAILQALHRCQESRKFAILVQALTPALKTIVQLQAATVCQWVQARRDHWLARTSNLSMQELQALRHAPIVGARNLFPASAVQSVDASASKSMQFNAYFNMAKLGASHFKSKHGQQSKYDEAFSIPDLARDPYVVRTGCSVVETPVRVKHKPLNNQQIQQQIDQTPASEVGRALVKTERAYLDHDDLPLATEEQAVAWAVTYEELVYSSKLQAELPVGGRLQHFVEHWRSIGCSRRIVRWLARGYRLPFAPGGQAKALACRRRSCPQQLRIHYADDVKSKALEELIQTLLEKDVIEEIAMNANVFHCLLFLRPKPNGKWRAITDVSPLNDSLNVKKFKMDTPHIIRQALTSGL